MWTKVKTAILAIVVWAAVVGGCSTLDRFVPESDALAPTEWVDVYGAHVFYQPDVRQPMSKAALRQTFEAAARYWGTKPDALKGWVVIQRGYDPWQLRENWVWGVSFMALQRVDFSTERPDCPSLVLVHEWGHAGAGIEDHSDSRFGDSEIYAFLVKEGVCRVD